MIRLLLILASIGNCAADAPFHLKSLEDARDVGSVNENFRNQSREIKSRGSLSDNNTWSGSQTFSGDVSAGAITASGASFSGLVTLSGGIVGPGLFIQQVSTFTANFYAAVHPITPNDDTIPQRDEVASLVVSTITARAATSVLSIEAVVNWCENVDKALSGTIAIFKDGESNAVCSAHFTPIANSGYVSSTPLKCLIPATDATQHYYTLGWGSGPAETNAISINGCTGRLHGGVGHSGMTITEVGQ